MLVLRIRSKACVILTNTRETRDSHSLLGIGVESSRVSTESGSSFKTSLSLSLSLSLLFSPSSGKRRSLAILLLLLYSWFTDWRRQTSAIQQGLACSFFHCLVLTISHRTLPRPTCCRRRRAQTWAPASTRPTLASAWCSRPLKQLATERGKVFAHFTLLYSIYLIMQCCRFDGMRRLTWVNPSHVLTQVTFPDFFSNTYVRKSFFNQLEFYLTWVKKIWLKLSKMSTLLSIIDL